MVTAGTFEGGDFNVIEDKLRLESAAVATEHREEAARQVRELVQTGRMGRRDSPFFDEYYVHIDLMVVPIARKLTAVCLDCYRNPALVDWLKSKGHEIIGVPVSRLP